MTLGSSTNISCGSNLTLTSENQHINTPNYPRNYPNNADCIWYIEVPEYSYVRFSINGVVERCCDYLKVL